MRSANSVTQPDQWQWLLIILALTYLGVVLLLPAGVVFHAAFQEGIGAFFASLHSHAFRQATHLTLIVTAIALPLNTLFGLCAAWVIARNQFRGRTLLLSIIDLPFSISPVVAGLMLVLLYGDRPSLSDPMPSKSIPSPPPPALPPRSQTSYIGAGMFTSNSSYRIAPPSPPTSIAINGQTSTSKLGNVSKLNSVRSKPLHRQNST